MPRTRSYCESTCEATSRVELSYLRRHGMLQPCRVSTLEWNVGGRPAGSVGVRGVSGGIRLFYTLTVPDGSKIQVDELVTLSTSRTNFGGTRQWLTCLKCRRRCGVLYGGRYFRCRTCHGLHYASQYEESYQRALDQADKIRKRLGGIRGAFNQDALPEKPKRMRWRTYARLAERYEQHMNGWISGVVGRFGLTV
jgi:hypothetical protein